MGKKKGEKTRDTRVGKTDMFWFWFAFSFIVKIEVFFKIIIEQKGIDPRPFQLILDTQLKATPCLNETKQ